MSSLHEVPFLQNRLCSSHRQLPQYQEDIFLILAYHYSDDCHLLIIKQDLTGTGQGQSRFAAAPFSIGGDVAPVPNMIGRSPYLRDRHEENCPWRHRNTAKPHPKEARGDCPRVVRSHHMGLSPRCADPLLPEHPGKRIR